MYDIDTSEITSVDGGGFWTAFACGTGIAILAGEALAAPGTGGLSLVHVGLTFAATAAACAEM
jgi:hypothetical protein